MEYGSRDILVMLNAFDALKKHPLPERTLLSGPISDEEIDKLSRSLDKTMFESGAIARAQAAA